MSKENERVIATCDLLKQMCSGINVPTDVLLLMAVNVVVNGLGADFGSLYNLIGDTVTPVLESDASLRPPCNADVGAHLSRESQGALLEATNRGAPFASMRRNDCKLASHCTLPCSVSYIVSKKVPDTHMIFALQGSDLERAIKMETALVSILPIISRCVKSHS